MIILLLFGCRKEAFHDEAASLLGEWKHIYSDVNYNGNYYPPKDPFYETLYPQDLGHDYRIKFLKSGRMELIKDGKTEFSYRVSRVLADPNHNNSGLYGFQVRLKNHNEDEYYMIDGLFGDTLMVVGVYPTSGWGMSGAGRNYFIRVK